MPADLLLLLVRQWLLVFLIILLDMQLGTRSFIILIQESFMVIGVVSVEKNFDSLGSLRDSRGFQLK